jgi:transcriptional regulator with XRE-family HTH domain
MKLIYLYRDLMSINNPPELFIANWKSVGRRIRELRGFDTNQSELAEAIGVAQSHISAAERGQKEIGVESLFRIARLYGKSLEWLLTGADRKTR